MDSAFLPYWFLIFVLPSIEFDRTIIGTHSLIRISLSDCVRRYCVRCYFCDIAEGLTIDKTGRESCLKQELALTLKAWPGYPLTSKMKSFAAIVNG